MRRIVLWAVSLCALATAAAAQHEAMGAGAAQLLPGFGKVEHKVTTASAEAQAFFNQGLAQCYGFNHEAGLASFQRAAELDPQMAMAYWGIAYAVGPNYNMPVDREREKTAWEAIQKAKQLEGNASQHDRDYIEALAQRYTDRPNADYHTLDEAYHRAMGQLALTYADDEDAQVLYAESGMNLRPWKLWNADGSAAEGTAEIVATLQSVLKRDPNHIGANHFYIHAVEASPHPELALESARRLAELAPASGHLVHMPAHIFVRTGYHEESEATNIKAAAADEAYVKETHAAGMYPLMYYSHNLHFIAYEAGMLGRYADARGAAEKLMATDGAHLKELPPLDAFAAITPHVLVRFRKWDEVMKGRPAESAGPLSSGMWHYARAMAMASKGNAAGAKAELAKLKALAPEIAKVDMGPSAEGNPQRVAEIAQHLVEARIAFAAKNSAAEIEHLRQAVAAQDAMGYNEPPDWFFPVRESLGGALLRAGKAAEAEQVFDEDLRRNPRNPRSLFGLAEALKAQKKDDREARQQFEAAWRGADTKLAISDL